MTSSVMGPRRYLVTGAGRGIGFATVVELLRAGACVTLHLKSEARRPHVTGELQRRVGSAAMERADFVTGDFASLPAVRRMARIVAERHGSLDGLINNAGVISRDRRVTQAGTELTTTVNFLAPFLLTHLLLPALRSAGQGRVINVSSMVARWGRVRADDFAWSDGYSMDAAYNASKLALVLFTGELAERANGVVAVSFEPGMTATDFGEDYRGFRRLMARHLWRPFMRRPEQVALALAGLALRPGSVRNGGHYGIKGPQDSGIAPAERGKSSALWDAACALLERPGIAGERRLTLSTAVGRLPDVPLYERHGKAPPISEPS